jgi:hypothetical protein
VIAGPLLLVLLAADPKAPPAEAPPIFLATSVRVHLRASEELDPDYLRALARKNVTLWLSTRTNTLRASTLETINKFGEVWIALRAPVRESDARQLSKVPKAGLWIDAKDLDGARRVLGPRRLAINLQGALDVALFEKLQRLRPAETFWRAPAEVDLLSWGLFRQLPGRKVLARSGAESSPPACPADPGDGEPTLQAPVDSVVKGALPSFPCGRGPRIEVPLDVDRALLQSLLVREPSTELVIDIGEDPRLVSKARRLLDDLGLK